MKAVRYHEFGDADVLRWEEAPAPVAGPGQVVIKVEAAGVNYADLMRRSGKYHFAVEFPAPLGTEAAGTVIGMGPDVLELNIGDRVVTRTSVAGCQAEVVAASADEIFKIPDGLSFVDAAAVPVAFLTAYHMLKTLSPLGIGEIVLINAAASGVGTAAVQLAKMLGGAVIAAASTDRKLELVRNLGADFCINYQERDFLEEVMRITDDKGVDRVLECVGGEVLTKSISALAPGGHLMIYGRASGSLPPIDPEALFAKNLCVSGLNIGGRPWNQEIHRQALEEILLLISAHTLRPVISRTYKMSEVAQAQRHLANRETMGKVVLVP